MPDYSILIDIGGKVLAKNQIDTCLTTPILTADSSIWFSAYRFGWGYCAFALPAELVCEGLGAADQTPKQLVLAFELGKHRLRKAIAGKRLPGTGERITLSIDDLGLCAPPEQSCA